MNDPTQPRHLRNAANRSTRKIEAQLRDKKLMSLRDGLIQATQARDEKAIIKYTKLIRDHNREDLETGLYE